MNGQAAGSAGSAAGDGQPGSVAEEAARLFEAVQDWARRAPGASDDQLGFATGAPECRLCPVCQLMAALRGSRPEVAAHLTSAAGSLLEALRAAVAGHEHAWASRPGRPVERIDIG